MLYNLFPVTLYKSSVINTNDIKNLCVKFVEDEYYKNPTTFDNPWDSDVFTTFNQELNNKLDWQKIIPYYIPNLREFANQLGISGSAHVKNAWINAYKQGQTHEIHDHLPGQFSACHYILFDKEEHLPTAFLNPFRQVALSNSPEFTAETPAAWTGLTTLPDTQEGDIVIFPSFLEHKAPRQHSEKFRIIISFNFNYQ